MSFAFIMYYHLLLLRIGTYRGTVISRFGEVASLNWSSTDALSEKSAVYGCSLNVYA